MKALAQIRDTMQKLDPTQWEQKQIAVADYDLPLHQWSALSATFPLARLLITTKGLTQQWLSSVKELLLDMALAGYRNEQLCDRIARQAWICLDGIATERATQVCTIFATIPDDYPLLTGTYPWRSLQNQTFWHHQYVRASLRTHDIGAVKHGANAKSTVVSPLLAGTKQNTKGISMPLQEIIIYFPAPLIPHVVQACQDICAASTIP